MNRPFFLALGLLSAITSAYPSEEKSESFIWNRATLALIDSGDAVRGQEIAEKQKCSKCHGETGIADEDDSPSIAGQIPSYHFKQLMDYKSKVREDRDMYKRVRKLSLQEMSDLAAFYATQEPEPPLGEAKPPTLVTEGDKERLLLPCSVCHGENGEGLSFEVPAIMGQKIEYFIETMVAFQEGERENDLYGRMRFIASQLTEEEIEQLAEYYSAPPYEEEEEEE